MQFFLSSQASIRMYLDLYRTGVKVIGVVFVSYVLNIMRKYGFLTNFLDKWPGKRLFGIYRFMPLFFLMGAALELSMIHWDFKGKVNFYRTYKKKQIDSAVNEIILERLRTESIK